MLAVSVVTSNGPVIALHSRLTSFSMPFLFIFFFFKQKTEYDMHISDWSSDVCSSDLPDMGEPRRVQAITQALRTENGIAHQHRADVEGLSPDTLYAWRVQGAGIWWSPWRQLRTAGAPGTPLVMLNFADTQNKNASLTTRVTREALRHAPDARDRKS